MDAISILMTTLGAIALAYGLFELALIAMRKK